MRLFSRLCSFGLASQEARPAGSPTGLRQSVLALYGALFHCFR